MIALREGMWILYQDHVGILVTIDSEDMLGEVHLVKEDGTTLVQLQDVYLPYLKQAHYTDIPLPRRPNEVVAHSLGYT